METSPVRSTLAEVQVSPAASVRSSFASKLSDSLGSSRRKETHLSDQIFYRCLKILAWGMIALLFAMIALLFSMAAPALHKFGLRFFTSSDWNPPMEIFGALPFIFGTVVSSMLAILIACPVSIGVAIFLTELAPKRLNQVVGFLVEMLAAIPSVVYGLWGVFVLAPFMQSDVQPYLISYLGPNSRFATTLGQIMTAISYPFILVSSIFGLNDWTLNATALKMHEVAGKLFAGPAYGVGMLTASIVLAIMIIPTITAISREVFKTVPSSIREAALALGATRWEMIKIAVLKTCHSGILGATILGLGRALGETMAVTMVIGNRNDITAAIMAPGQTMASVIANEYPEASGVHLASLAAVGLALFGVSLVINSIARFIIWRVERGGRVG
jgi:phosphate transport system permease protein